MAIMSDPNFGGQMEEQSSEPLFLDSGQDSSSQTLSQELHNSSLSNEEGYFSLYDGVMVMSQSSIDSNEDFRFSLVNPVTFSPTPENEVLLQEEKTEQHAMEVVPIFGNPNIYDEDCSSIEGSIEYVDDDYDSTTSTQNDTEDLLRPHEDWVGEYNFRCEIQSQDKITVVNNKMLICKLKNNIILRIKYDFEACKDSEMKIRGSLIFTDPQRVDIPVSRCDKGHLSSNDHKDDADAYFLVHVSTNNQSRSSYKINSLGVEFVTVPLNQPAPGVDYIEKMFKFNCLNSCHHNAPGHNRIAAIFELLRGNQVIGRWCTDVKVCMYPDRDSKSYINKLKGTQMQSSPKRRKAPHTGLLDSQEIFYKGKRPRTERRK